MAPNHIKTNSDSSSNSRENVVGGNNGGNTGSGYVSDNYNTSSIDFWNSPDYFKLYDDISLWNQTLITNQTSIPSSASSSSVSSILPHYDDPFNNNNNNNNLGINYQKENIIDDDTGFYDNNNNNNNQNNQIFDYISNSGNRNSDIVTTTDSTNNNDIIYENLYINHNDTNEYNSGSISGGYNGGIHPNYDGGGGNGGNGGGGSNFMLLLEDFGEYFYNYNSSINNGNGGNNNGYGLNNDGSGSFINIGATSSTSVNYTDFDYRTNCSSVNSTCTGLDIIEAHQNYWALLLIIFPILTLFGNILVIISVCRERSLQTVTNYFIVSLALADLLVAVFVMPFGVYVLLNGGWYLPNFVCDFYIAMDVICSTSSIFNLVAISIDRYIAVTQPIKYAKHKNSRRVCLTILLVWAISAAIGSPIVLGLNNTPNREPNLCIFYNTNFIVYSSLSSFYIPCIIMVFLYWNIFKALRHRARKQRAARKPHLSDLATGGSVIENIAQTRRLAETTLDSGIRGVGVVCTGSRIMTDEQPTNTASGSNEEEDENAISPEDIDDCHVIVNDKSTEFMLATVVEETGHVVAQITSTPQLVVADPNGNHDSGYAPSNIDDVIIAGNNIQTPPDSPMPSGSLKRTSLNNNKRNGLDSSSTPKREPLSVAMKPLSFVRYGVQGALALARNDSTVSAVSKTSRKDKKNSQTSRFTLYKVHKASKKKREKSSAKKERKATKTLAIVLGVFLICWVPFFTCNIMDAMCTKLGKDCQPGVTAFILTTWLGYMNSFVNPVIYTIFNPEFRKAFKKIMHMV